MVAVRPPGVPPGLRLSLEAACSPALPSVPPTATARPSLPLPRRTSRSAPCPDGRCGPTPARYPTRRRARVPGAARRTAPCGVQGRAARGTGRRSPRPPRVGERLAQRGLPDLERGRHLRPQPPAVDQLAGHVEIVRRQLGRAADMPAPALRCEHAGRRPLADQVALELRR